MQTSMELLKDIVAEEFREYVNLILMRSPVTLFDPENGRIEANFVLPVEIKKLDELPDLMALIQQIQEAYQKYAPDMDTLNKVSDSLYLLSVM